MSQNIVVVIEPLDISVDGNMMTSALRGIPCADRTVINVDYPAALDDANRTLAEGTAGGPISIGVAALDSILRTSPVSDSTDVLVFAYSIGAQVASAWLRLHANDIGAPDPRYVSFLLIGNPERKYGGIPAASSPDLAAITPNNTAYAVQDLKIQYDGWADWPTQLPRPNVQSTQNAMQGIHTTHVTDYMIRSLGEATMFYTENTTVYAMIPNDLPMFDGYRKAGQQILADKLQAQYQPLIETQYIRPETLQGVLAPRGRVMSAASRRPAHTMIRRR